MQSLLINQTATRKALNPVFVKTECCLPFLICAKNEGSCETNRVEGKSKTENENLIRVERKKERKKE